MLLATVSSGISSEISGAPAPSQRSVLMKGFDEDGFVFFTNHGSRKARQMRENAAVSAVFPWYALHRQVIIEGRVGRVGEAQSLEYFHSRPRDAQLGAWASRQSETLASRRVLEERMAKISERFLDREIPLPDVLGWLPHPPSPHRILAGPNPSLTRPHTLHPPRQIRRWVRRCPRRYMPLGNQPLVSLMMTPRPRYCARWQVIIRFGRTERSGSGLANRRGGRVVEGARLESVYTLIAYRGFESLSLRQSLKMYPATASVAQ